MKSISTLGFPVTQLRKVPKCPNSQKVKSSEKAFSRCIFPVTTQHEFAMKESRAPALLD